MNKTFKSVIAGALAGVITVCALPAIADGIEAVMNSVNISLNGEKVASSDENYVLQNGAKVPYSILYEGTTYLPVRKISELLDIGIDWDNATRTVLIEKKENDTPVSSVNSAYDPWYGAPDFGLHNGISEISQSVTTRSTTHWYDIKNMEDGYEDSYAEHLESLGYERTKDGVKEKFKVYKKDNIEVWLDLGMYTKLVYGVTVVDTTRPVIGREIVYNGSKDDIPSFSSSYGFDAINVGRVYYSVGDWHMWACLPDYFQLLENEGFSISSVGRGYYGKTVTFKKERTTFTVKFDGYELSNIPAVVINY